jgi:aspartyl-tRNA(Asn)/glutamyl-tRNA(Gln) amidotransferase subunit A
MTSASGYCELRIAELMEGYRRGDISPTEVVKDSLARAEASADALNAFVTICAEEALARASQADRAFREDQAGRPLEGLPITVKDILPTKGICTTFGSPAFTNNVPTADAESVARLVAAGAIVIGKTATPPFACRQTTSSPVSGVTRNPLHRDLTPGGSSGGSAAATAVGAGFVSVVTDGGGSARLPAACVGIVGMKPTLGRIPFDAALDAFGGIAHIGIMARSAADLEIPFALASGQSSADPYSYVTTDSSGCSLSTGDDAWKGVRVGLRLRLSDEAIASEFVSPIEDAVQRMHGLGAQVGPLDGDIEAPLPIWQVLQHCIWAERYADRPEIMKDIDPVIAAGIEHARALSARNLQAAFHARTRLFRRVQAWFDEVDVIATPTLARPPLRAEHPGSGDITIDGAPAGDIRRAWAPFLGLFTMTGHPAISLNCGWTAAGLPVGLQLVGRWGSDEALLRLARRLEDAMPDAAWRMPANH